MREVERYWMSEALETLLDTEAPHGPTDFTKVAKARGRGRLTAKKAPDAVWKQHQDRQQSTGGRHLRESRIVERSTRHRRKASLKMPSPSAGGAANLV